VCTCPLSSQIPTKSSDSRLYVAILLFRLLLLFYFRCVTVFHILVHRCALVGVLAVCDGPPPGSILEPHFSGEG
jgi:hypothetical protein